MIKKILKVMMFPFAFSLYKARCNYVLHLLKIGYLSALETKEKLERMSFRFKGKWIDEVKVDE